MSVHMMNAQDKKMCENSLPLVPTYAMKQIREPNQTVSFVTQKHVVLN